MNSRFSLDSGSRNFPEAGFSLSEVLVALGITSALFLAALSMLSIDQKIYHKDDATLEAGREARYAMEMIERDLLMMGYQVDVQTVADNGPDGTAQTDDDLVGQERIVFAAPWEIVFNGDVDPNIDAIHDDVSGATLPSGYAPVTFGTGAETIRYTLDSTGDGTIAAADHGDDAEESVVSNPGLYILRREVYGYNGSDNTNPSDTIALIRGPVAYPSGAQPSPLFLYWGDFDSDADLDLWGDNGAGGGTANNGILEASELAALGPVTDEDVDDDGTLDAGEDRNGNGVLDRRISDIIKLVDVHLTAETSYPDKDYRDATRSSTSTPWRYRSVTQSTKIKPRNIELPGGACGDYPEPITSPVISNACADVNADGKLTINWGLSADDGDFEMDVERYIVFRTDKNNVFSATPYSETGAGISTWTDNWINFRSWPPKQYWYKVRAMDCTPQLSEKDPVAGPYPALVGAAYPKNGWVEDLPGDDGSQLRVNWEPSPDENMNTTGYGGIVKGYWIYRSTSPDFRCQTPVHASIIDADGSPTYNFVDNASNSTSAPVFGTLYYYWMRSRDDNGSLSPYSPRFCARSYRGPTFPLDMHIRTVAYDGTTNRNEIWFMGNPENEDAGYDPDLIRYRIYLGRDTDGDGYSNNMVNDPIGLTANERLAEIGLTGIAWAVGSESAGKAFHTRDGGAFWDTLPDPSTSILYSVDFVDRLRGIIVGTSGSISYSTDGGATWDSAASATAVDLRDVVFTESFALAVGDSGTLLRSEDDGVTWTPISTGVVDDLFAVATDGQYAFIVGDNGVMLRSVDGGLNWSDITSSAQPIRDVCTTVNLDDPQGEVWITGNDEILMSKDKGNTWTTFSMGVGGEITSIDCVAPNSIVYAASEPAGTVIRFDAAIGPSYWNSPGPPTDVAMIDSRRAWVSDQTGYVHSRGLDGTWSSYFLSNDSINALAARPDIVWEDTTSGSADSGSPYYYVVTSYYNEGNTLLDGETAMLPDRDASVESPDDTDDQILVDACQDFQLFITAP